MFTHVLITNQHYLEGSSGVVLGAESLMEGYTLLNTWKFPSESTKCLVPITFLPDYIVSQPDWTVWITENFSDNSLVLVILKTQ